MHRRVWSKLGTLRVRLTAWYMLLLSLTLALFSGYLYFRTQYSILAQVDSGLRLAATQATINLDEENGRPTFQNTEIARETALRLGQSGFAVRVISPDGVVWDGIGDFASVPVWLPQTAAFATIGGAENRWRIYSQPIELGNGHLVGWLQAAQSLGPMQETLERLLQQILLGLPLVVLTAGLSGFFLASRALRPIDRITRTAQAISASDLTLRIGYRGPADEVGRLATTLDRMLDRLQVAFERERRFTADASHELRTPLTTLKGRIGVTLSRPRSRGEYEDTLRSLEQEVDRLIRLSNDLLLLARLDQGQLRMQPVPVDLSDALNAVVAQMQPLADEKGLTLASEIPQNLLVDGNWDHLIRLFLNLLDNAVKYTPRGGRVTVQAEARRKEICVRISDTGPGIAPEHIPHLFERFYRVETARSRDTGGAGLGLAVAYEIARWHGGSLEVASKPGEGTTFQVCLPTPRREEHLLARKE
ncbi:MAG: ATP-binding protein [Anaerolineae bacterium]